MTSFTLFPESSFFREGRAPALPSPAEVRTLNEASNDDQAKTIERPPPVKIPSLGLIVKYGTDVTIAEIETQVMMYERLRGQIPMSEVFGWIEDGNQRFLYMELIDGDTLQSRFPTMNEAERQGICKELRLMVNSWRALDQCEEQPYVGSVGKRPLNDYFVERRPDRSGPYLGANAVREFHNACGIDIDQDMAICFTHNDLCPPNILISHGPHPKVVGIIDWGQAGWYPLYWECSKSRRVGVRDENFTYALYQDWVKSYLPIIFDPMDEERVYHPWLYFMLSNI
ncbi:hypothetical protein FGRMN_4350 [Fusarium graminum]|nr:hypothetical protein FGRMN_4350 [Fusarium graminum]